MNTWGARVRLSVVHAGLANTIQDLGRAGHRHHGVPLSGALDIDLARCANALVYNNDNEACVEMRALGPRLICEEGPVLVGLAGEAHATIARNQGTQHALEAWSSATLFSGDVLHIRTISQGCAYLAFQAGLDLPSLLGSRSGFAKWNAPGLLSRPLAIGDALCTPPLPGDWPEANHGATEAMDWRAMRAPAWRPVPASAPLVVRAIPGPQVDHFSAASQTHFWSSTWTASVAQDRMGLRLQGEPLLHASKSHQDMVSEAVTPGAIQVPTDGQPIALLADCQTMGGYPKIAVVISADLPLLAHCPPGTAIQFSAVDLKDAHNAKRALDEEWRKWRGQLRPYSEPGVVDHNALQLHNLISGAVDASEP